jgi:hypothetical protein
MRRFLASLLIVGLVVASASGADRQDQLFASWEEAQRGVTSLVVTFTLETWDPTFDVRHKADGTFRLFRTPKGELLGSYEITQPRTKGDGQVRVSGLLNNATLYLLDNDQKMALMFELTEGDLLGFLARNFNPFVLLLDRKLAEEKYHIEVIKEDKWYTYLAVNPKQVKRYGWFPDSFHEGRVVLMNKASEEVPRDMPRQLWYTDGSQEYTFEINKWRLNADAAPKAAEFIKPEDRPGWQVGEWPFRSKK